MTLATFLRWILLLPIAVVAGAVAPWPIFPLLTVVGVPETARLDWLEVPLWALRAIAIVLVGSLIAPSRKLLVAMLLSIVPILWASPFHLEMEHRLYPVADFIAAFAGSVVGIAISWAILRNSARPGGVDFSQE